MKQIYTFLLTLMLLAGCKSEKETPKDELLSGTKWLYSYHHLQQNPNGPVTVKFTFPSIFGPILKATTQPELKYTVEKNFFTKDTVIHKNGGEYYYSNLTFNNNNCTFSIQHYDADTSIVRSYLYDRYTFDKQTYLLYSSISTGMTKNTEQLVDTLKIVSDGIYYYPHKDKNQSKSRLYILENYRTLYFSKIDSLPDKIEKKFKEQIEEIFEFQRVENELILNNQNKRIIGTINQATWEISLTQILPDKKELKTLKLM